MQDSEWSFLVVLSLHRRSWYILMIFKDTVSIFMFKEEFIWVYKYYVDCDKERVYVYSPGVQPRQSNGPTKHKRTFKNQ